MTKRTYLFLAAAALALASCSNDDDFADRPGDGRVAVNFSGGITLTRATGDAWDLNDGIGIYMVETGTQTVVDNAANRRYVTAAGDGRFSPARRRRRPFLARLGGPEHGCQLQGKRPDVW